jgi:uncharacterized membrane protein
MDRRSIPMPPIPAWDAAHPIIVHFPVALLLFAPLLIVAAMLAGKGWKPLAIAAFLVLACGLLGAVLSVLSGEAAESAAEVNRAAYATLEEHEELAELTRNLFIGITAAFALIIALGIGWKRFGRRGYVICSLLLLLPYAYGALTLAKTAHRGGLLVHHYGVRAPLVPVAPPAESD